MNPQPSAPSDFPVSCASIADRLPLLRRRAMLTRAVRSFFDGRGYLEVETPFAVAAPGEEVHLRPFATERIAPDGARERLFLHTSPEFAMKRLVAATGLPLFQLARVWRNGEGSALHAAEFTLLEWYRPGADLAGLMDETEALLRATLPPAVARASEPCAIEPCAIEPCAIESCAIDRPFERLTLQQAFARHVGADLLGTADDAPALAAQAGVALRPGEGWEDLFFRLLLTHVEPNIGRKVPTFLTHWPASQAALAARDPADPRAALRFELYACGIELANAFEELADPDEQRRRFLHDRARRGALYPGAETWPLDEAFLASLSSLPPCAGIALGFDRLVMLATGVPRLSDILWLGR